jgi:CBS domain-containing protein
METMLDTKITILPVIEDEQVVGVVTRTDLVRLIEQLESALDDNAGGSAGGGAGDAG